MQSCSKEIAYQFRDVSSHVPCDENDGDAFSSCDVSYGRDDVFCVLRASCGDSNAYGRGAFSCKIRLSIRDVPSVIFKEGYEAQYSVDTLHFCNAHTNCLAVLRS
jgi:hypothetical protein